ncbi:serine hydrolase [Chroococcus sp. FPU101]|uniref:serine hydrolase domain-containing protein n=1 Tax=Chroococcus sp. FPU101 TaxID=1974212 RepID=UPI001A8C35B9|nr:serine hydrolase domain-containing protein [Chroococcus sp. FPU101]GFE71099.1 Serine-type D-Ala-D-Ala carboxypeptidase [Chroococcus sp. FPU101]
MKNILFSPLPYLSIAIALITVNTSSVTAADLVPRTTDIDRKLNELVTMSGGPPGAVVVIQRGNHVMLHTAGVADSQTQRQIQATDYMRIASVAKAFSGAVSLSLVNQGLLSLDDTIGERLPSLPQPWAEVTLRQLLNHTSGLPDFSQSEAFREALIKSLTIPVAPSQLLEFVANEGLEFEPPGSQYQYSNSDNIAVALMIEAVTGRTYEEMLQEQVFTPLGLTQTSLPVGVILPTPFIHGYNVQTQPPEDVSELVAAGWAWASGGIVSTPSDLNQFIRGYASGQLFGADIQAQQFQFVPGASSQPPGPGTNSAGLGIFRYETRCGTVYGHTGNTLGYTQFAAATSDGQRSVVVSINGQITPQSDPDTFAKLRSIEEDAVCAALASIPESSSALPILGFGLLGLYCAFKQRA